MNREDTLIYATKEVLENCFSSIPEILGIDKTMKNRIEFNDAYRIIVHHIMEAILETANTKAIDDELYRNSGMRDWENQE